MFELHVAACALFMGAAEPTCFTITSEEAGRGPWETVEGCEAEKPTAKHSIEMGAVKLGGYVSEYSAECINPPKQDL